jgi:hypothetical protein
VKNAYENRGDTTAIFINSPKYGAMETLIATSDLPRAQEFPGTWGIVWDNDVGSFYVSGNMPIVKGKYTTMRIHRWILLLDDPKLQVDHTCHDTLDNCRWALNVVTCAENQQNRRKRINNTSGFVGVTWNRREKKWHARIDLNGRRYNLGWFTDLSDAVAARQDAELACFTYKTKIN